ncbi:MAG: sugar isomerase domain-containing protein [Verrucomicrobiota bacterium]
MSVYEDYLTAVQRQIDEVTRSQRPAIETTSRWVAEALVRKRYLFVFGTGHSHMLAEELFYRAGGLARVIPILDEPLMLHRSATRSTDVERQTGYADQILSRYPIEAGDILIVASNSGRNAVPIELAQGARSKGARVVGLTSLQQTSAWPSRHPTGLRLKDVCDLVIDNGCLDGDAGTVVPGLEQKMGPTSSVIGTMLMNLIAIQSAYLIVSQGHDVDVFVSSNTQGDGHNARLVAELSTTNPHL